MLIPLSKIGLYILFSVFSTTVAAQNHVGVFLIVKNNVQLLRGSENLKVNVGQKVQEGDVITTDIDSRAKIVMNDRNIINVAPSTKFKITKYTAEAPRNVSLDLENGKIRNNVYQKYDGRNEKYEVRTATAVAGVRGTRFITSYDRITKLTQVVTLKGQVAVLQLLADRNTAPINVNRGEKIEVREGASESNLEKVPESELKNIELETDVQKDGARLAPTDTSLPPDLAAGGEVETEERPLIPPTTAPTATNNIIERKFEKSRIRIITQPPN